ncbi:hypothetical protein CPY51_22975 [Rhizobium tubonense]|uniref:Uncharacterized protein n=1 Tax=Rhizobium tubonense TaxID=484088 RepID=A0A2W4EH67_9HYPH|nr:hypothetical protein CPY51_22975 [Rhizobium tubonense]
MGLVLRCSACNDQALHGISEDIVLACLPSSFESLVAKDEIEMLMPICEGCKLELRAILSDTNSSDFDLTLRILFKARMPW